MSDDTQDAKAQKLASARKKLKEYQQRCNNNVEETAGTNTNSSTVSIASNLSEQSDCELTLNNGGEVYQVQETKLSAIAPADTAAFFSQSSLPVVGRETEQVHQSAWPSHDQADTNVQIIQVLIGEKAQLNTELTKARHAYREKELELEELRTEHIQTTQRLEQMQHRCQTQQQSSEQQLNQIVELQHSLEQAETHIKDRQTHLDELEAQVKQLHSRLEDLHQQYSNKCNELDMAQLRLRQLSDESNVNADNRIESLTQTQYMYEQQIRDLQQMVSQLTQDKEQAAIQYQNYVSNLSERNSELSAECGQLKEREHQLVEHVSGLEREIQKNLALQAQYKESASQQLQEKSQAQKDSQPDAALQAELASYQERVSDLEFERHEFQLKIKSQDDQLQLKEDALNELQQELQRLQTEQPDLVKLMATIESDKVAASRALSQNVEMKQQLDELQQHIVQLTNDKAELVNKLDSEEFGNREMRLNYAKLEDELQTNKERYKFKDEEMIRLSHENVELQRTQLMLQQQLDRLQHYEAKLYHNQESQKSSVPETEDAEPSEPKTIEGEMTAQQDIHLHEHCHESEHNHDNNNEEHSHMDNCSSSKTPLLATEKAVEKLQSRFTTLISQVADLTEEKHSLEHLVLQLQGETETIGEYIALYQTQRRMLKQREYEKATQMRLLKAEREQLREKINALNTLVGSLGLAVEIPVDQNAASDKIIEQQQYLVSTKDNQKENENSQQILHKIQNIITEIKVNTEQSPTSLTNSSIADNAVDHLNCCLGKFEVV